MSEAKDTDFGFEDRNPARALEELAKVCGDKNRWFVEFVKILGEIKNKQTITDISIRTNQIIKIGLLKSYVPLLMKHGNEDKVFTPTEENIIGLVNDLTGMGKTCVAGMSSLDFAIAIYGIGILRINYSKDTTGPGLAIRFLDFVIPGIDSLNYPAFYRNMFDELITERKIKNITIEEEGFNSVGYINTGGLILHVGPTGSGKSTAIASEIRYLADRINGAILTYENPIEYRYIQTRAVVRQFELGKHIRTQGNLDIFETAKYHLLRNSPSVAMISEVKTKEEIYQMLDTANRGHLIFSTMHTKTTVDALSLLNSVTGDFRDLVAASLLAIVAHNLYFSREGVVIPIYEILKPNEIIKKNIIDGQIQKIKHAFYNENKVPQSIKFKKYIDDLMQNGTIKREEYKDVLNSMKHAMKIEED